MGLFGKNIFSRDKDSDSGENSMGIMEAASKLLGGSSRSYEEVVCDENASDREKVVSFLRDYIRAMRNRD